MSKRSKELRSQAADQLRRSRNGASEEDKAASRKRAAAYKALAENEEWLDGERQKRSRKARSDFADERRRNGEFGTGERQEGTLPYDIPEEMPIETPTPEEKSRQVIDGMPITIKA